MRKVLYAVIIAVLFVAPVKRADIAKLLPVQAVVLFVEDDQVVLRTDTENLGRGNTAVEALQNLKATTPAVVYLDTAKYLLVSEEAIPYARELRNALKPSVRVCVCQVPEQVKEAVKYLEVHRKLPKFRDWKE